jgi:hypothetical protein
MMGNQQMMNMMQKNKTGNNDMNMMDGMNKTEGMESKTGKK